MKNDFDKLLKLNGSYYKWNSKMNELSGKKGYEYGLIAQEVQKQFPEMVQVGEDGYLTIDYIQLIPIIIESIKHLKSEIDALKGSKINNN
jgi:hypothetical protein